MNHERYRGCLLGLAVGDALGMPLEGRPPGTFNPVRDMTGGGPVRLPPGHWTDDTAMALCLGTSLVERDGFNQVDQLERYLRWWRDGYMSSTGRCFGMGSTVHAALSRFEHTGDPKSGQGDPLSAGNGSLMRLAPVPMAYAPDPVRAVVMAAASSKTTHATAEAVDACRYFAGLLAGALRGAPKDELLAPGYGPQPGYWDEHPLAPAIAEIAAGSFREKDPPAIEGTAYVVRSLEAALWAFDRGTDFEDAVLRAVNLGDDADTTGAVCGQLAGAHYGLQAIPQEWLAGLAMRAEIEQLADALLDLSGELAEAL